VDLVFVDFVLEFLSTGVAPAGSDVVDFVDLDLDFIGTGCVPTGGDVVDFVDLDLDFVTTGGCIVTVFITGFSVGFGDGFSVGFGDGFSVGLFVGKRVGAFESEHRTLIVKSIPWVHTLPLITIKYLFPAMS
jgi:hypothetical protein